VPAGKKDAMTGRFRPRSRQVIAPIVVAGLLTSVVALLTLETPPWWLAWRPPWLAAVLAAVLGGTVTAAAERWTAPPRRS
jgi:hypothetical protein